MLIPRCNAMSVARMAWESQFRRVAARIVMSRPYCLVGKFLSAIMPPCLRTAGMIAGGSSRRRLDQSDVLDRFGDGGREDIMDDTRREFIKGAAVSAGLLVLPEARPFIRSASAQGRKKIRFASAEPLTGNWDPTSHTILAQINIEALIFGQLVRCPMRPENRDEIVYELATAQKLNRGPRGSRSACRRAGPAGPRLANNRRRVAATNQSYRDPSAAGSRAARPRACRPTGSCLRAC